MKTKSYAFKNSIKVIQLFRNINTYGRDERSFEDRKEKLAWKPIQSKSGYVANHQLYLPETLLEQNNFELSDLIIIVDDNFEGFQNTVYTNEKHLLFKKNSLNKFDFIQIKLDQVIELYLKPGYFETGMPKRQEFKICQLQLNKPIAIKINGKRDFSLTGRRTRTFVEQEYIFIYIGDFNDVSLLKEPLSAVEKTVPAVFKEIDLMKTLY